MKYDFSTFHTRHDMEAVKWDELKGCDPSWVPLSVADMELLSPPEIIEELTKTAQFGMWGYTWWSDRYFNALQKWMKERHDWEVERDWLVQTNGVVQALYAAVRAFTKPEDSVLIMTPVYYPFYRAIRLNGRNVVESPLVLKDGKYEIDFEDFEEKAKEVSMFILCNPHNPVGRVWTEEELRKIGDICLKNNVLVISDDIHFDIIMDGYKHTCFPTLGEEYAMNCVHCAAPSKTFSLAGLCVANVLIPNPELKAKMDAEVNVSGCYTYSTFGYRAMEVGYEKCAPWVDELNEHIKGNYDYVCDFMKKHFPKVWIADLEGTYLCWLDMNCFGLTYEELAKKLREEAGLYLDDGYIFGPAGEGFERINLACPRKVLEDSMARFLAVFAEYAE